MSTLPVGAMVSGQKQAVTLWLQEGEGIGVCHHRYTCVNPGAGGVPGLGSNSIFPPRTKS